jgi:hypothetical protein
MNGSMSSVTSAALEAECSVSVFAAFRMVAMAVVALLGVSLIRQVGLAIRTGTAKVRGGRIQRRTRPGFFWTAVVVQAGFAVVCLIAAAWGVLR